MLKKLSKKKSPLEIAGIVVIFLLLLAIICTFVLYGIFKDSNTAPKLFGSRVYIMNSDSMEPRIKKGSAVFIQEGITDKEGNELLKEGNVILCTVNDKLAVVGLLGTQEVVAADGSVETHYLVKYDKGAADEVWSITREDIIGKAKTYSAGFGALVNFASSKTGMLLIVIVPCALLIAYEVVMLILAKAKKKNNELSDAIAEAEDIDEDEEIERLRQEILESRKKAKEEAAAHTEEPKEDLGGTKPFKLEFSSDKKKTAVADSAPMEEGIKLRKSNTDEMPKLAFTSDSEPEPIKEYVPKQEESAHEAEEAAPVAVAEPTPVAKPAPSEEKTVDLTKMTSADLDALIKMLEAEKARLENQ